MLLCRRVLHFADDGITRSAVTQHKCNYFKSLSTASEKHSDDMSEGPEDVEGCCKGFLSSILAIYRRPGNTVVGEMKNTTTKQHYETKNTTTKLIYDETKTGRRLS